MNVIERRFERTLNVGLTVGLNVGLSVGEHRTLVNVGLNVSLNVSEHRRRFVRAYTKSQESVDLAVRITQHGSGDTAYE